MGDKYVEKRFVGHGTQLSCMKRIMLKIGSGGSNEERNIFVERLRYTYCSSGYQWNLLEGAYIDILPSTITCQRLVIFRCAGGSLKHNERENTDTSLPDESQICWPHSQSHLFNIWSTWNWKIHAFLIFSHFQTWVPLSSINKNALLKRSIVLSVHIQATQ